MTFTHALPTNNYGPAKFVVSANAYEGTHTTIASALAAASSGDTIFIRTGSYTEDLTLKAGVNLTAFSGDSSKGSSSIWNVKIIGKLTATFSGNCNISNIYIETNSNNILAVSGAGGTNVNLLNCYLYAKGQIGITCSSSSTITLNECQGNLDATGSYFALTAGDITANRTYFYNGGGSTVASTCAGAVVSFLYSFYLSVITTSGASVLTSRYSFFTFAAQTILTLAGTSTFRDTFSDFETNTASCISVGTGCTCYLQGTKLGSTNTNVVTGIGTLYYCGLIFHDTTSAPSHTINTTTQIPQYTIPGAINVVMPAGDYTILASDEFIGATTSAARAITLPASPIAGQNYIVKDITGSAGTSNITVSGNGNNILGTSSAATYVMNVNYGSATFVYNGTDWCVV